MSNIYSALFVDFDNMYLRLRESCGKDAAEEFAVNPTKWLDWMEKGMSSAHFGENVFNRRILIRKCYLNPASFGKFRPYFTRAGFEVVDCPQLTSDGKTSTDIHMVMDIMDALLHPSNFEEFILFSADADFTPVLIRVRQHKRQSVVIAAGYSSPAYKSACDYLPPLDIFLQQALGIEQADDEEEVEKIEVVPVPAAGNVLKQLAQIINQRLASNPIVNSYELPALYKRIDEFRDSTTWLGYKSLRRLTYAIIANEPSLKIFNDLENGIWGIQSNLKESEPIPASAPAEIAHALANPKPNGANGADQNVLLEKISKAIIERVSQSSSPVIMANLAEMVNQKFSNELAKYEGWLGAQSFKSMLMRMDLNGLKIDNTIPGYVYDPLQHTLPINRRQTILDAPQSPLAEEFKRKYPEIEPLAARIHQLTDMPYLLPEHYVLLLTQIARAVNENGFQLTQITRLVRDRCVERGAPVARSHVNFIVNGISYAGHKIGDSEKPEDPEILAASLLKNTLNLCRSVQMLLGEEDEALIRQWLYPC